LPSAAFGASPVKPAEIDLLWRMQPCAASAPTISRLRRLVRVKRERWRNDGLTAGRHAGPLGDGGSRSLVDAALALITNF